MVIDHALLTQREKNSCFALLNTDIDGVKNPIAFLHDENKGITGKPVTFFTTEEDYRDHVSADDVFKCRRYEIKKIARFDNIFPRDEIIELECPVCASRYYNTHPLYIIDPCQRGCNVSVSKMIVTEKGNAIDVGSGTFMMESKTRGKQEIAFYIDRHNLDINRNHAKLQLAAIGIGLLSVDAIPFVEWIGNDKTRVAIWVTRATADPDLPTSPRDREIEFTIDVVPRDEKSTVQAVFFKNLEFMQFYLGFNKYHLQSAFPDFMARRHDGSKIIIEFEHESRNFDKHGHDPSIVDYIICWIDNRTTEDDVKIISLSDLVGKKIKIG